MAGNIENKTQLNETQSDLNGVKGSLTSLKNQIEAQRSPGIIDSKLTMLAQKAEQTEHSREEELMKECDINGDGKILGRDEIKCKSGFNVKKLDDKSQKLDDKSQKLDKENEILKRLIEEKTEKIKIKTDELKKKVK